MTTGRRHTPPKEHRWKPGQSGNPRGRPKGALTSLERIVERELARKVDGDPSLGDRGRISRRTRLVRGMLDRVEAGDAKLTRLLLDRVWPITDGPEEANRPIVIVMDDQDLRA